MMILNNDSTVMQCSHDMNLTAPFISTDDEAKFEQNKKKMGKKWRYYDDPIEYKFNSDGYRTKEVADLSSDFMLTFGCSYTEGVGLHIQDIWTHYVSKHTGYDLYNHAKGGTGIDIQYYNGLLWNMGNRPKPKLVIAQWPYKFRKIFGYREDYRIRLCDPSYTKTPDGKWWGKRYIQDDGELSMNVLHWFESFNNTWKLAGVPVLNFTWDADLVEELTRSRYQLFVVKTRSTDRARDLEHDGPIMQEQSAEKINNLLKLSNFTDKI